VPTVPQDPYQAPASELVDSPVVPQRALAAWVGVIRSRPAQAIVTLLVWPLVWGVGTGALNIFLLNSMSFGGEVLASGGLEGFEVDSPLQGGGYPVVELLVIETVAQLVVAPLELWLVWRLILGPGGDPKARRRVLLILSGVSIAIHLGLWLVWLGAVLGWVLAVVMDPVGAALERRPLFGGGAMARLRKLWPWMALHALVGASFTFVPLVAFWLGISANQWLFAPAIPSTFLWMWLGGTVLLVGRSQLRVGGA